MAGVLTSIFRSDGSSAQITEMAFDVDTCRYMWLILATRSQRCACQYQYLYLVTLAHEPPRHLIR